MTFAFSPLALAAIALLLMALAAFAFRRCVEMAAEQGAAAMRRAKRTRLDALNDEIAAASRRAFAAGEGVIALETDRLRLAEMPPQLPGSGPDISWASRPAHRQTRGSRHG